MNHQVLEHKERLWERGFGDAQRDPISRESAAQEQEAGKTARPRNIAIDIADVILPVFLGGIIYLGWRSTNLKMFTWGEFIGVESLIIALREQMSGWRSSVSPSVLFSLPDGLWAYSFARFHYLLYLRGSSVLWLLFVPIIALGSEVGQAVGVVPGVFDWIDILFYAGGIALAFRPWRTR